MPTITLSNQVYTYHVTVNRRSRTMRVQLLTSDQLEIVSPKPLTVADVAGLLQDKAGWLQKHADKLHRMEENPVNAALAQGAELLFLGTPHTLILIPLRQKQVSVYCTPGEIIVRHPAELSQDADTLTFILRKWYTEAARTYFTERTQQWAQQIGVSPQGIRMKDQKTRWGSCSTLGNINFNWRVVMAPPAVIDYLIIHELSHMLFPNHSPQFWEKVRQFCPAFQQRRNWLRENGGLLTRIL